MLAFKVTNLNEAGFPWISFSLMVAAVLLGAFAVFCWAVFFQKKRKRKRRHRGHGRIKPTLAEMGGLPPLRRHEEEVHHGDDPPFDP